MTSLFSTSTALTGQKSDQNHKHNFIQNIYIYCDVNVVFTLRIRIILTTLDTVPQVAIRVKHESFLIIFLN